MTEEIQITGGFPPPPPPPLSPKAMGMCRHCTGMDRTEGRQGGQGIDELLVETGWEHLDKWMRKGLMPSAPQQSSTAQATEQPQARGCRAGTAPGSPCSSAGPCSLGNASLALGMQELMQRSPDSSIKLVNLCLEL